MKKSIIFAVCALFMGLTANAQFTNTTATKNAGTMGSYENYQRVYVAYNPLTVDFPSSFMNDMEFNTSFSLGYSYAFSVTSALPFYVEAGAALNLGSYTDKETDSGEGWSETYKSTITQFSLVIPVNVMYNWHVTESISLVPYVGLNARAFLSMKEKDTYSWTEDGESDEESDTFNLYDKEKAMGEYLKRVMFGYQIGVQAHFNSKFYAGIEYNGYFGNLLKEINDVQIDSKISGFSISLGLLF